MDPKKIATIDVNIVNLEPTEAVRLEGTDWNSRFIDEHHHCPLCGTELLLTNVTHFIDQKVKEEAFCEPCNIRIREQEHGLQ